MVGYKKFWVVLDGLGWFQVVSDCFGWVWVVCCFSSYHSKSYSRDDTLKCHKCSNQKQTENYCTVYENLLYFKRKFNYSRYMKIHLEEKKNLNVPTVEEHIQEKSSLTCTLQGAKTLE